MNRKGLFNLSLGLLTALCGNPASAGVVTIVDEPFETTVMQPLVGWEGNVGYVTREYVSDGVAGSIAVQMSAELLDELAYAATTLYQNGSMVGNELATRENTRLSFDIKVDRPGMESVMIVLQSWGGYLWNWFTPTLPPKYTASVGVIPLGKYNPGKFTRVVVSLDDVLWTQDPYPNPTDMLPLFDPSGKTYNQIALQVDANCFPELGALTVTVDNVQVVSKCAMVPLMAVTAGGYTVLDDFTLVVEESGLGTHLGTFSETITFPPGSSVGAVEITAANGDKMFGSCYPISDTLMSIQIDRGTGRFEGVLGSYNANLTWTSPTTFTARAAGNISSVGR